MELSLIITISCVMTAIAMGILVFVILMTARFGSQWVKMLIDRFTGGGGKKEQQKDTSRAGGTAQAQIASSQSLRRRARDLDFPAPGQATPGTAFATQSAPGNTQYPDFPAPNFQQAQQASLTPRGGQYPDFNPQAQQGSTQSFGTPSLSPSRPFQAGSQFNANQATPPNQFGQQNSQQNFGQQPPNPLGQPGQQQNFGQQPPNPLSQRGQQQNFGQQPPNPLGQRGQQRNFGQQPPNPLGQPGQQRNFGQPPQQQQGGLGQNRPPLRSRPRPGNTQYDRPIGRRDRRQGDDRDVIYDDGSGGDNFVDDVGDFIDNF